MLILFYHEERGFRLCMQYIHRSGEPAWAADDL